MQKIYLDENFRNHLLNSYPITEELLNHILDDIGEYFSAEVKEYIGIRHQQLQKEGLQNRDIYTLIRKELKERRFASPDLTLRQIRRIIYG